MRSRGWWVRSVLALVATVGLVGGQVVAADATPSSGGEAVATQCADAHLKVRVLFDPKASGAGQRLAYVDLQNTGATSCTLHGAPGVSLVGHGNGTQIGRPADRSSTGAAPVVRLSPGQSARADLAFSANDQGGGAYGSTCRAVHADGYRIYPPHSYRSVFVASPQYGCANTAVHWGSIAYVDERPIGCAATSASIPAGAVRKTIADVDGDGIADTEWITNTRFGIRTASGATSSVVAAVAGGAQARALGFRLENTAKALVLIAGNKDAQLFRFATASCTLRPVLNVQGQQYRFDLTGVHGNGVACVDPDGNGVDQIAGTLLSRPLGALHDGDTETISTTPIRVSGLHAVNGRTRSTTVTWPGDEQRIRAAAANTCGGLTFDRGGIMARTQ